MYQILLRMVLPHEKKAELLAVLQSLVGPTEVSKGCRECRASCDAVEDDAVTFWARWDQHEELENFVRSDRFRQLLPYIELSTEPPYVEVGCLEILGGMERILAAMGTQSK